MVNKIVTIAPTPEFLLKILNGTQTQSKLNLVAPPHNSPKNNMTITKGGRNNALYSIACSMRYRGMKKKAIGKALWEENLGFDPPLEKSEVRRILNSAIKNKPRKDYHKTFGNTDLIVVPGIIPLVIARHFLDRYARDELGNLTLLYFLGEFYRYTPTGWKLLSDDDLSQELYMFSEFICIEVSNKRKPYIATEKQISELVSAIKALDTIVRQEQPCWMSEEPDLPTTKELIVFQNCIFRYKDRCIFPLTPKLFVTNVMDYAYLENPPEPKYFMKFLRDLFDDDIEALLAFQDMCGYIISGDTSLHKIFIIIGPPRAGKGVIAQLLGYLVGITNSVSMSLNQIGDQFGMQCMLGKSLVVFPDARISRNSDMIAVTENLLKISGQDFVTINRKYKQDVNIQLGVRFVLFSNEIPRFVDSSNALAARLVTLQLRNSFEGKEDRQLSQKLKSEISGIFSWALDGLDRVRKTQTITQPKSGFSLINNVRELASSIVSFLDETCEIGSEFEVEISELYGEYKRWCEKRGRKNDNNSNFGRKLKSQLQGDLGERRPRIRGKQVRYYVGLRITGAKDDLNDDTTPF